MPGELADLLVQRQIRGVDGVDVAVVRGRPHASVDGLDLLQLVLRELVDDQLPGELLQHRAQGANLGHVLMGQRRHRGALVGNGLDEALFLQPVQGFAQRGARDAELRGQARLHQRLARLETAGDDRLPQSDEQRLTQGLLLDGREIHHRRCLSEGHQVPG